MNTIRLQVALAKAGVSSRRKAIELIASNRVRVNGEIVDQKGARVNLSKDRITFDGRALIFREKKHYYILNKPAGVVSTVSDERGRRTILDCVQVQGARLYPVGRLDKDTTGLIILTDDGELTYRLTHPKFGIDRVYEVKVKGAVEGRHILQMQKGVFIEGRRAKAKKIVFKKRLPNSTTLIVTMSEGKKREVRTMFAARGYLVFKLKRIAYGPLRLGNLPEGAARPLTAGELQKLKVTKKR